MDARELYRAGKLAEALAAQTAEVKRHPADTIRRGFLAELLLLSGELERVDKHLDLLSGQEPQGAPAIALLRQVVRAEKSRIEFWTKGRPPEFVGEPTETMRLLLQASIASREGDLAEAARLAEAAEEARPTVSGTCGETTFADMRDLDDLCGGIVEVLTTLGTYLWVPVESIASLAFHAPKRPRDLLWRAAAISVTGGMDGEVFIPAVYCTPKPTEAERLARTTEWVGDEGAPVRGRGQRAFLIGEEAVPILEIDALVFDHEPASEGSE